MLKFPNSHEICGHIKFFLSKTRPNVLLIHIEYRFMCIMIGIIMLTINYVEPYCECHIKTLQLKQKGPPHIQFSNEPDTMWR